MICIPAWSAPSTWPTTCWWSVGARWHCGHPASTSCFPTRPGTTNQPVAPDVPVGRAGGPRSMTRWMADGRPAETRTFDAIITIRRGGQPDRGACPPTDRPGRHRDGRHLRAGRYAEGAWWSATVVALCTPIGTGTAPAHPIHPYTAQSFRVPCGSRECRQRLAPRPAARSRGSQGSQRVHDGLSPSPRRSGIIKTFQYSLSNMCRGIPAHFCSLIITAAFLDVCASAQLTTIDRPRFPGRYRQLTRWLA